MNEKHLEEEYTRLIEDWTEAEAVRQRLVERLRTLDGPPALDDPMWEAWDSADELAGSARQSVRSFLTANRHSWRR